MGICSLFILEIGDSRIKALEKIVVDIGALVEFRSDEFRIVGLAVWNVSPQVSSAKIKICAKDSADTGIIRIAFGFADFDKLIGILDSVTIQLAPSIGQCRVSCVKRIVVCLSADSMVDIRREVRVQIISRTVCISSLVFGSSKELLDIKLCYIIRVLVYVKTATSEGKGYKCRAQDVKYLSFHFFSN